jgi:hypothetical protein
MKVFVFALLVLVFAIAAGFAGMVMSSFGNALMWGVLGGLGAAVWCRWVRGMSWRQTFGRS